MGIDATIEIAWRIAMAVIGAAAIALILVLIGTSIPTSTWTGIGQALSVIGVFVPLSAFITCLGIMATTGVATVVISVSRKAVNTQTVGNIKV